MTDVEHRQGCPATGGYGHGVEPCTCGAITGPELLPLPEALFETRSLRLKAEIEALRAELREAWSAVDSKAGWEWKKRAEQAETRAERLAEALRNVRAVGRDDDGDYAHRGEHHATCVAIAERALLRDQEEGK